MTHDIHNRTHVENHPFQFWNPFRDHGDEYVVSIDLADHRSDSCFVLAWGKCLEIHARQKHVFTLPEDVNLNEITALQSGNRLIVRLRKLGAEVAHVIPVEKPAFVAPDVAEQPVMPAFNWPSMKLAVNC